MVPLDEASKGIMPVLVDEMVEMFRRLKKARKAILLSKQNVESALAAGDCAYLIDLGRTVRTDTAVRLLASPEIHEPYWAV